MEVVEVGSYNLPPGLATQIEEVAGSYATAALVPGDYILSNKVASEPISSDPALASVPDGMVAISVTAQTLATALSDKLQPEDIIRFYHYDDQTFPFDPVQDIPALHYLKVLSVTDSNGIDVDYSKPLEAEEEKRQTATITVLASPEQAMLLTRYENEGILHAVLISRGNKILAEELLQRQTELLKKQYGTEDKETNRIPVDDSTIPDKEE